MRRGIKTGLGAARPSPALVVAFLALLVALGGTAGALTGKNGVDNNDLKKNSVDSANIAKNQVKADDVLESSLAEVPSAANGVRGYALVNANGTVNTTAPSSGITSANITNPSAGIYCFNTLTFTPKSLSTVGDAVSGVAIDNFFATSVTPQNNGACPGAEQASMESRDDSDTASAALQNSDFYIVFY